jgi:O-methyltransferase involved in polyketide biosynthesis
VIYPSGAAARGSIWSDWSLDQSQNVSAAKQTFFIWEGVTQYLTQAGLIATFEFLARAAPGSRLTFTYVRKDFVDGKTMRRHEDLHKRFVVKGVRLFGMEPDHVEPLLDPFGWRVIDGYQELVDRHVRPTGRELAPTPVERIVYAEKL